MSSRNSRGRGGRSRTEKVPDATDSPDGPQKSKPKPQNGARRTARPPDHPEHHRMMARNLNGLLENVAELRNDFLTGSKDLKSDFKALDAKLFKLQTALEKLDRSHTNFMEEMTTVAFDTNLEVRGAVNSIDAIWDTLAEIVPKSESVVANNKREAQEREKRRVAAIDAKLKELADSARKNRKNPSHETT